MDETSATVAAASGRVAHGSLRLGSLLHLRYTVGDGTASQAFHCSVNQTEII